jgi:transcriptional regulator with XRE-family HTH domain
MESGSPRFAEGGLTIQTIFGTYGAGTVSADNIASALAKELKIKLEMLPPDERTRFKNQILRAAVEFGSMDQKEKSNLTNVNEVVNLGSLKPQLPSLLDRLNAATLERGRKSELAKFLGVSLVQVSQWLNRDREPGGETTLRLLKWVEQEERQK